jgi:drug/metabolite transporter (DMT)-like permease
MSVASLSAAASGARRGITFMFVDVLLFTFMDIVIKWLGEAGYPTMQLMFFRSFFAFVPLSLVVFRGSWRTALRINDWKGHAIRCVGGGISMAGFFYAFKVMPLSDVIAIGFAAPIFITALSIPLLGEHVGIRRWSACLVGFAGVLVIVQPGPGMLESGALVALGATVFYAIAAISVRKLSRTETNASIIFSFTFSVTVVSACFLPFQWVSPKSLFDLALLILLGLLGGTAQIFMTEAFRATSISIVMPFEYTAILWTVILQYLIWHSVPGLNLWLGAPLVIASGIYIVWREAALRGRKP